MRTILILAVLALIALTAPALAGTPAEGPILLRSAVVVDGPIVRLGDLFDGLGEKGDMVLARAPEPGQRAELDARWLAAVAQAFALPWRPSSPLERVVVERASVEIDGARIEEAVREALERRAGQSGLSLALDDPAQRLHLPSGTPATLAVAALSHDPDSGRFVAQVVAPADGPPLVRAAVTGRAVEMADIPVLSRRVEADEVIRRQDVEWRRLRADRVGRSAVSDISAILGKSPRRPLRVGEPILASDLRAPVVIAKNALVTIRLETARMVLTAQGRSLEPGAEGDVIRVMNTKSNTVISAQVTGSGAVRVYPTAPGGMPQEANLR